MTLAVEAVGVNFRDVLKTLDLYPLEGFEWRWLGGECAGTVIAAGHEVEHLKPGDAVVAIAPDCMASSVVADARLVCKRPGSITVDEAAGVPIAFLTAWYSLVECARLQAGETVLIHAGAGGVGQAAVQIASHLGARVLATASPEKHGIVRALGADAVFNSRDLSFPDAVRKATEGAGVDVVLNSLAGHALRYGLDLLRPFGRFIEIGKRDIYANNSVDLRSLRDNRSFRSVDLASWLKCCPDAAGERLSEILKMLDAGKLRPISDHVSPISAASETFRGMSQGRHTGKLVLDARPGAAPARVVDRAPVLVRQEGSYLITGGTSGFGLHVAGFLAEAGASHLVLASQTGRIRAEDEPRVAAIRALGAAVSVRACDVVERGEVADLLSEIRTAGPKLRGIVYGAMVLDDVDVLHLDAERLHRVMGPKVVGAWHLDEASERDPLDWFLLQGSVSAMMGASGQANYVVANHLLAALAADRRCRGLPAQLIAWGPLAGNGVVARSDRLRRYFELIGFPLLTEQAADEALGQVLRSDVEAPGIFELDWSRFAASAPDRARSRRFLHLREGAAQSTNPGALAAMIVAVSPSRRRQILGELVAGRVASVLGLGANDVQPDRALGELGIDSLMAVELSIGLEATLGRPLPVTLLQAERTLAELTDRIDRMFSATEEKSSHSAVGEPAPDGRAGAFTPALRTLSPGQLVDPDVRCPAAALTYIPEEVVERGDFSPDQLAAAGDDPHRPVACRDAVRRSV